MSQDDQGPSYSSYPLYLGMRFDVVFIDGRRRMECALSATQCLAEGGIVILHDWKRSRYQVVRSLFDVVSEEGEFLVLRPKHKPESIPMRQEQSQRHAIVVPVRGDRAERELAITRPFFEKYAAAIGADFHTVGTASIGPSHRLKASALEVADRYDRIIVADCDILIRDHTPSLFNIVPGTDLGVFFEGQVFPREQECADLNVIYALDRPMLPNQYFNSGLMVLSRDHYCLLKALESEELFGHPQYEQGFLNCQRLKLDIPTFPLTVDFNYIPDTEFLSTDWRFGFIVHFAGSGKEHYRYESIWQDVAGDGRTFTSRKALSADVRDTLLRCAARQLDGQSVQMLDPTDFIFEKDRAYCYCSSQGRVIGRVNSVYGVETRLAVYGAKRALARGSYRARFVAPNEQTLVIFGAKYDVFINGSYALADGYWPADGIIDFTLEEDTPYVEIRLYSASTAYEFVRLEITLVL